MRVCALGCAKLPNILNCIIPLPNLIPIPKNVSPSKKNTTYCMFRLPPLSLKFYAIAGHSTSDFGQLHVAQKNP